MNELGLTSTFISNLLINDATISGYVQTRVHRNVRPPDGPLPCIVFQLIASPDVQAIGCRQRLFTRPIYLVKAITEGTDDIVGDAIATAIDNALVGQSDFVGTGGLVKLGVYRLEPIEYVEQVEGVQYNHVGGQYRIFVHRV